MAIEKGFDQLTTFEKDLLLRWFFHKMPMDQRHELMRGFPLIYNKAVGHEVMAVTNQAHEKLPVKCPVCQTGAEGESTYRHEVCAACRNATHWECPTCLGPPLADSHDGRYNLCESCNAWYEGDRRLMQNEIAELRLDESDDPMVTDRPLARDEGKPGSTTVSGTLPVDEEQDYGGL